MNGQPSSSGAINFNPRTREGCDWLAHVDFDDVSIISIHAPVKGATVIPVRRVIYFLSFQSTHP